MPQPPTILISAFRNFSVRYLLHSGIFARLKSSDARLVILVKDGLVDYYRQRLGGERVTVLPVLYPQAIAQVKKGWLASLFTLTRKCTHGRAPGMVNSTDRVRLYQYARELGGHPLNRAPFWAVRALSALGRRSRRFRRALLALESALFPGRLYDAYLAAHRPDLVVVSSLGYQIDPLLMRAARRHGIKVASIIHSWDNPTTKDYRGAEPDRAICWNRAMAREVEVYHDLPAARILLGGIAHWDMYFDHSLAFGKRDAYLASWGFDPARRLIFYATSAPRTFPGTFDVIERLLAAMEQGELGQPACLLVRLHPQYLFYRQESGALVDRRHQERMDQLGARFPGRVAFTHPKVEVLAGEIDIPLAEMATLAESLHHCDLLLTEYSTVMIEGAIFDRPVINVGLSRWRDTDKPAHFAEEYAHLRRMLAHGASRNAHDFPELIAAIRAYLADPSLDREKRAALVAAEIDTNRGRAGGAIGQLLYDLAAGGLR